jgi:DNA-binding GntR family transcriptional regulator
MKQENGSNLSEPVYNHLVEMLLTQELKPGDRIPESKLADQFGISRTPIREALRRLASEGVIKIYPNRFAEVMTVDDDFIIQLGQARIAIDTMLTKLCIYYGSNADFEGLRRMAKICTEATKTKDYILRTKTDMDFHLQLAHISHNQFLIKYQTEISLRVKLLVAWKYLQIDKGYDSSLSHLALVDALEERDEKKAEKIAVNHLVDFYGLDSHFPAGFFEK